MGNQGIDKVFERRNTVFGDRAASVEVKSSNWPQLQTDRLGIQQATDEFNRTRLARAAQPARSSADTVAAARRLEGIRDAGKLESYKGVYDPAKRSMDSLYKVVSDPATRNRTVLSEIRTWLLW